MNDYEKFLLDGAPYKMIKTIDGEKHSVHINNIVGYCHVNIHEGYMTANLMKSHRCREKKCRYFEKFTEMPYWNKTLRKKMHNGSDKRRKYVDEYNELYMFDLKAINCLKNSYNNRVSGSRA